MKAMMKNFTTFFLIIIITVFLANGQGRPPNAGGGSNNTYTSITDGLWHIGATWGVNNNQAPDQTLSANNHIIISEETEISTENNYNITLNSTGNNGGTITVKGTLILNGDLTVNGMDWVINVEENGVFIINGNVHFGTVNNDSHPNQTKLTINGDVHVNGDFSGHGNVDGVGNLYVEGELAGGINTVNFNGIIAEDIPNSDIPAPENLMVHRDGTNHRLFLLSWEYDTEATYIIDDVKYEFAGFRIIRNLDGKNHSESIVRGYFIYDDNTFEGFDNTVLSNSYIDIITDADIIEGVEGIDSVEDIKDQNIYPEYYVRAVFVKSEDGSKNLDRSDYLLSPNSEATPSNQPLPIELLHFSAKAEGQSVTIQWATAAEINNDFFTLERSMDGNNWEVVTYVYGAGNSNYVINYEYTDEFPLEGISYYRLKQTDFDGQFEYFSPVAVYFSHLTSNTEIVNVRSNRNSLYIQYTNETPGATMVVADIRGRILGNFNVQAADFVQDVTIDLPGNYTGEVVMIRLVASGSSDERKLVIR